MKLRVFVNGDASEMREARARADEMVSEGFEVEVLDWETEEAEDAARLYDIYTTPAFVITGPEGKLIELWQGSELPLAASMKHLM